MLPKQLLIRRDGEKNNTWKKNKNKINNNNNNDNNNIADIGGKRGFSSEYTPVE